eukprot:TRINITY_DN7483_c0_g1_i1.p1 TRINITY_DN7483_c0_g1~~TRINITY_DN7483_c0_g1_i1.p1  ORF type:complete len:123 (-),score=2.33 TRINITY_DN7483_c0_g1_i1:111-479(-)
MMRAAPVGRRLEPAALRLPPPRSATAVAASPSRGHPPTKAPISDADEPACLRPPHPPDGPCIRQWARAADTGDGVAGGFVPPPPRPPRHSQSTGVDTVRTGASQPGSSQTARLGDSAAVRPF